MTPAIWIILAILGALYALYRYSIRNFLIIDKYFPGPEGVPIFGNIWDIMENSAAFYTKIMYWAKRFPNSYRLWIGHKAYAVLTTPEYAEAVLGSTVQITKSGEYSFLHSWLGQGLLTSTGSHWKKHRKILTPAFHFKILEKFVDVINNNGNILCERLSKEVGGKAFDIYDYIKLYALDNICETAMGISINAQRCPKSDYIYAIRDMCEASFMRSVNVFLHSDFLYFLSKYYRMEKKALKIIHKTTNDVIRTRKAEFKNKENLPTFAIEEDKDINIKQKFAFLDILLLAADEQGLTDEDIRNEVDTFMFEGHDTITSGISFSLYNLATYPKIQQKVLEEQISIFGNDPRDPTYKDLQDMKYLEQVIKDSLRLYPSVPYIGREMVEDLKCKDGAIIPKGTQVYVLIAALQRNPQVWPNPDEFNPDNYSPENIAKKHPYAATPFSAGPRNCIGQKFAMLELKSSISKVVRKFELLESPDPDDKPQLTASVILNSKNGIKIKLAERNKIE